MSGEPSLDAHWRQASGGEGAAGQVFAFDCDKTLISGDLGEASLRAALRARWVVSHDAWWRHLDVAEIGAPQERAEWRRAYERDASRGLDLSTGVDPLSDELWSAYEDLCTRDVTSAYIYAARLAYQRTSSELSHFASQALERDAETYERPLMRDFVSQLQSQGGEVWVVSSSQREIVSVVAARYHIPLDRVVGVDFTRDEQGRSTDLLVEPAPIKEDKVHALAHRTSKRPALMVGDSWYDLPLMSVARSAALIDHGRDPRLSEAAVDLGAAVIPHRSVEVC